MNNSTAIVPGSVRVSIGANLEEVLSERFNLVEGVDFTIDYQNGILSLSENLGPAKIQEIKDGGICLDGPGEGK